MSEACLHTERCERSSLPNGFALGPFRGDTETQCQPHSQDSFALAWIFQILLQVVGWSAGLEEMPFLSLIHRADTTGDVNPILQDSTLPGPRAKARACS